MFIRAIVSLVRAANVRLPTKDTRTKKQKMPNLANGKPNKRYKPEPELRDRHLYDLYLSNTNAVKDKKGKKRQTKESRKLYGIKQKEATKRVENLVRLGAALTRLGEAFAYLVQVGDADESTIRDQAGIKLRLQQGDVEGAVAAGDVWQPSAFAYKFKLPNAKEARRDDWLKRRLQFDEKELVQRQLAPEHKSVPQLIEGVEAMRAAVAPKVEKYAKLLTAACYKLSARFCLHPDTPQEKPLTGSIELETAIGCVRP